MRRIAAVITLLLFFGIGFCSLLQAEDGKCVPLSMGSYRGVFATNFAKATDSVIKIDRVDGDQIEGSFTRFFGEDSTPFVSKLEKTSGGDKFTFTSKLWSGSFECRGLEDGNLKCLRDGGRRGDFSEAIFKKTNWGRQ